MKTKIQKAEEIKKGEELFGTSRAVLFVDFSKVGTADLRNLRQELKKAGSRLLIMKKRLLALVLKKNKIEWNPGEHKTSIGAVFAANLEEAAGSVYRFYRELEKEKKIDTVKILGGYDREAGLMMDSRGVITIGQLPPREVILAQLLGMLAAPIRSFLYVLDQKSKKTS